MFHGDSVFNMTRCLLLESENALLKMSTAPVLPDFSRMTEDEQIAYALQMSMQGGGPSQYSSQILHFLN